MTSKIINSLVYMHLFFFISCSGLRNQIAYPSTNYPSLSYDTRPNPPTNEEIKGLKYPKNPKNYEKIFKETISNNLKDPDSAKYKNIKVPLKFWGKNTEIQAMLVICGTVNAKNSMGGYTGYESMAVATIEDSGEWYVLPLDNGANRFAYSSSIYPCLK